MVVLKGISNLGPAASLSLLNNSVSPILEIGNCPLSLSYFCMAKTTNSQIIHYGGTELKARTLRIHEFGYLFVESQQI